MPAPISRSTRLQKNIIKTEDQFFYSFNRHSKSNPADLDRAIDMYENENKKDNHIR